MHYSFHSSLNANNLSLRKNPVYILNQHLTLHIIKLESRNLQFYRVILCAALLSPHKFSFIILESVAQFTTSSYAILTLVDFIQYLFWLKSACFRHLTSEYQFMRFALLLFHFFHGEEISRSINLNKIILGSIDPHFVINGHSFSTHKHHQAYIGSIVR